MVKIRESHPILKSYCEIQMAGLSSLGSPSNFILGCDYPTVPLREAREGETPLSSKKSMRGVTHHSNFVERKTNH